MTVKNFFKSLFTVLVVLGFLRLFGLSLSLTNEPSDLFVLAGVAGAMGSVFTPYLILKYLWRKS